MKSSRAYKMATSRKSKYNTEINSIALLLIQSNYYSLTKLIESLRTNLWEDVLWAGVIRYYCLT